MVPRKQVGIEKRARACTFSRKRANYNVFLRDARGGFVNGSKTRDDNRTREWSIRVAAASRSLVIVLRGQSFGLVLIVSYFWNLAHFFFSPAKVLRKKALFLPRGLFIPASILFLLFASESGIFFFFFPSTPYTRGLIRAAVTSITRVEIYLFFSSPIIRQR